MSTIRLFIHIVNVTRAEKRLKANVAWPFKSGIKSKCYHPHSNERGIRVVRSAIENGEVVPPPEGEDLEDPVRRSRKNHKYDLTKCR
jgi:hypothetical protein